METIITEQQMKDAFRTAYDFVGRHREVLRNPEDYAGTVDDIQRTAESCGGDRLAMRIIVACYEYIYEKSEAMCRTGG